MTLDLARWQQTCALVLTVSMALSIPVSGSGVPAVGPDPVEPTDTTYEEDPAETSTASTLGDAHVLLNSLDRDGGIQSTNLTQTAQIVALGLQYQLAQTPQGDRATGVTDGSLPAPPTPAHDSPSAAVFAFLDRFGITPSAEQAANIRGLDQVSEPTRRALTEVVDAYLAYHTATEMAATDGARTLGHESKFDERQIRASQLQLVNASAALDEPDTPALATPSSHNIQQNVSVQIGGYLSINLSTHDDTYTKDYVLQIDSAGDDTYDNNAGGAYTGRGDNVGAAALIDLTGDDTYLGRNGGATAYNADHGLAAGFLLDANGTDTYDAISYGANGGGDRLGVGFLLDSGMRDDTYISGIRGVNGGGSRVGKGFLFDTGGNDEYVAQSDGTNGGGYDGGVGLLLDANGSDTYNASTGGVNGGANYNNASGTLVDVAGADAYNATVDSGTSVGVNGGVNGLGSTVNGFGLLLDGQGIDAYVQNNCNGGTNNDDTTASLYDDTWAPKGTAGAQIDSDERKHTNFGCN